MTIFFKERFSMNQLKILHIDLNSCFATVEQQARPTLRGRPVAISNRLSPNSMIITASYEAKARGVKCGVRRRDATKVCPDIVFLEAEPSKYVFVFHKLENIMRDDSPDVVMKSIDEGVINLARAPRRVQDMPLADLATEIKSRLKSEIGCWMRCNIGVGANRFLAKLAAELHKPDGFDIITPENQRAVFATRRLTDLPGINVRMQKRLNAVGIFTPLELLDAPAEVLEKMVWKSIDGRKWYGRLRGVEYDDYASAIKSVGRQYVLESSRLTDAEIRARLFHLAEDVGGRLRSKKLRARGVYVWATTHSRGFWRRSFVARNQFFSNNAINNLAQQLWNAAPADVRTIGVTLYKLSENPDPQLSIFADELAREEKIASAVDAINLRFGARTIVSAATLETRKVKTKIPFGSTRYLTSMLN
jgi:DNA polymerase-4